MSIRPIDIARKLKISTTTLRNYEELSLVPPVARSESGYRIFTEEHIAYFVCIRDMMAGFTLALISKIMKEVITKKIDSALWIANKAQADLHQEKIISKKILQKLGRIGEQEPKLMTINDISKETGVPATTIRYWDKVGLISAKRCTENNYRMFTSKHIQEILTIYALKYTVYFDTYQYSIDKVKEELKKFDYSNTNRIISIANDITKHLDKVNRAQISSISALYHLCTQVETNNFEKLL